MAVYVMSDLHGNFDALKSMLVRIGFSQSDTLYILGDVVDRGQDGVRILQYVMEHANIRMLLGNHEYMMLQYYKPDATERTKRQWNRNGNYPTLYGMDAVSGQEQARILAFLTELPSEIRLTVAGRKYILVHGFLGEDTYRRVWNRPRPDDPGALAAGEMLVIGHTPVCEFVCPGTDEEMYVYSRLLTERDDHFRILHAPGFIDVDCCLGYGFSAARLACLRLDDGQEFYEKGEK